MRKTGEMGTLGAMAWRGRATCLGFVLAVACSSPSAERIPPVLDVQTSPSTLLRMDRQDPVSIHGRLVAPSAARRVAPDQPMYVVAVPAHEGMPSRRTPPVITRGAEGFSPKLCVVAVGARVRFDNRDRIFHSFFATASGNEFDLAPLDPGNSAFVRFQRPGLVHVYCSLHSGHRASILVVPSNAYARVDEEGRFRIDGLMPGRYALQLWSEDMPRARMDLLVTGKLNSPIEFAIESVPAKAGR